MKNQKIKKVVTVFLSLLMLMSCMMCVASAEGDAVVVDPETCQHDKTEYITNVAENKEESTHILKCLHCLSESAEEKCEFTKEAVEATCYSQGYDLHICTVCGYGYRDNFGDLLPHEFGKWQLNEGNCNEVRTKTRFCTTPGCLAQETDLAFDENGEFIFGEHSIVVYPGKAATCTKDGYSDYTICLVCNALSESETIPATGHVDKDEDGNCDKCRSLMSPEGHCSCFCHGESSLEQFIYKIAKFFWKLFKMNEICECGATKHW